MVKVIYEIVEHDGGWAYRVDGSYSETFRTHDEAKFAARRAAVEQQRHKLGLDAPLPLNRW